MEYQVCEFGKLKYVLRFPDGFSADKQYPVIICMHGAGGRGKKIDPVLTNPFFVCTEKMKNFPFVMVAPLCSENTWFDLWGEVKALVEDITARPYTDKKHIYAMGASMGGYATWQLAMSMPEYFAAIVPICGGGMYWNTARLVNVPVWAFHGGKDDCVYPEESEKMVRLTNERGGNAKLTVYPENGHNAWSDTYSNPEVFEWMLSHENVNAKELIDKYDNVENYG